jgi:hypothetical protein
MAEKPIKMMMMSRRFVLSYYRGNHNSSNITILSTRGFSTSWNGNTIEDKREKQISKKITSRKPNHAQVLRKTMCMLEYEYESRTFTIYSKTMSTQTYILTHKFTG